MKLTLKRDERLRKKKEILEVIKRGKKVESKFFSLYYLPSENFKAAVSTKKHIKKSVRRNRNRRRVKELLRTKKFLWEKPCRVFVIVKEDVSEVKFKELEENFVKLLEKANAELS